MATIILKNIHITYSKCTEVADLLSVYSENENAENNNLFPIHFTLDQCLLTLEQIQDAANAFLEIVRENMDIPDDELAATSMDEWRESDSAVPFHQFYAQLVLPLFEDMDYLDKNERMDTVWGQMRNVVVDNNVEEMDLEEEEETPETNQAEHGSLGEIEMHNRGADMSTNCLTYESFTPYYWVILFLNELNLIYADFSSGNSLMELYQRVEIQEALYQPPTDIHMDY